MLLTYSGPVPSLKGLLEFVRLDLQTLRPSALADLRHDLILFTVGIGSSFELSANDLSGVLLRQLQRDLRSALHTLFIDGMPWELPQSPKAWKLEPPVPAQRRVMREPQLTFGLHPFRAAILARAADAIREHWSEIRDCPYCGQFFAKVRRQKFCSPRCRWATFAPARQRRDYAVEYRHRRRAASRAIEKENHQRRRLALRHRVT
jgi:hypothetical protein